MILLIYAKKTSIIQCFCAHQRITQWCFYGLRRAMKRYDRFGSPIGLSDRLVLGKNLHEAHLIPMALIFFQCFFAQAHDAEPLGKQV